MKPWLILLLFCLLQPLGAKRIALVIGNGVYDSSKAITQQPNLKNTRSDARLISSTLKKMGFEVILLEDVGKMATIQALNQIKSRGQGASLGVVFFAGHGFEVDGNNYLVPVGARLSNRKDPETFHVNLNLVLNAMTAANIEAKMVILDCCRNDPLKPAPRAIGIPPSTTTRNGGMGVIDRIPQSTLIMLSAALAKPPVTGGALTAPLPRFFFQSDSEAGNQLF
ncbi:MAG: caspase family protein [Akkermansiaceae bacterium]